MARRVDRGRVVDRAVIHPHDDVPAIVTGDAHRHRATVCVDRNQRARRVETDADDGIRRDGRGRDGSPSRVTDGVPYVVRRLLDVRVGRVPDLDRVLAAPDQRSVEREACRAHASGPDVDAQQDVVGHRRSSTRTRNPSRRESSTMSAKTSPYATATWLLW